MPEKVAETTFNNARWARISQLMMPKELEEHNFNIARKAGRNYV
jgi:hypothetical protein